MRWMARYQSHAARHSALSRPVWAAANAAWRLESAAAAALVGESARVVSDEGSGGVAESGVSMGASAHKIIHSSTDLPPL